MADYLEAYAAHFELPVRTGRRASTRCPGAATRFVVEAGDARFEADQVVVAMANYQQPARARRSRASSTRASSSCTRATTGTRRSCATGGVLIVGAGNSGAEIAMELARAGTRVWMSGRQHGPRAVPHRRLRWPRAPRAACCCAWSSTAC